MAKVKPISLDGSTLEGGGQLVRVALSLSAITGIPVNIYNIRANRARNGPRAKNGRAGKSSSDSRGKVGSGKYIANVSTKVDGGLKDSHLAALNYLALQSDAHVEGAEVGSREVTFIPGAGAARPSKKNARSREQLGELVDLGTNTISLEKPGSVWLIFQALYPFLIFFNHNRILYNRQTVDGSKYLELTLRGGTNVPKAMSSEYVQQVFLPTCSKIGLPRTEVDVMERGWAGDQTSSHIGTVKIRIYQPNTDPFTLPAFSISPPDSPQSKDTIQRIDVTILFGDLSLRTTVLNYLSILGPEILSDFKMTHEHFQLHTSEDTNTPQHLYILLVAHTRHGHIFGRDFLGGGRKPRNGAELDKIVENACTTVLRDLRNELLGMKGGSCVDEHMQDQLVVFQALAKGLSKVAGGVQLSDENKPLSKMDENGGEGEEPGDVGGSLHTRTVRWVCERMLRKQGIRFEPGGRCQGTGLAIPSDNSSVR